MKKSKISYDPKKDILYIMVNKGIEERFEDISRDITIEYDAKGKLIGIEIFNASKIIPSRKIMNQTAGAIGPSFVSK